MDSFEQNAIVKVNELQAVYNDMQRKYIVLDNKLKNTENALYRFTEEIKNIKNELNSKSLWSIIKNKLLKRPIC